MEDASRPRLQQPRPEAAQVPGRPLRRRDSMERREALLKGHQGSRQRRRWENDRLISNPHAAPPLPSDYLVPATHPVRNIPYYLAPLWDAAEFQRAVEARLHGKKRNHVNMMGAKKMFRKARDGLSGSGHSSAEGQAQDQSNIEEARRRKKGMTWNDAADAYTNSTQGPNPYYGKSHHEEFQYSYGYTNPGMSPGEIAATTIPREIKQKLKWKRGSWAKGLLKDLEEDVRGWVFGWEGRERAANIQELERKEQVRRSGHAADGAGGVVGDAGVGAGGDADGDGDSDIIMNETDTEDEEIVFVGRNGSTTSLGLPHRPKERHASQITLTMTSTSSDDKSKEKAQQPGKEQKLPKQQEDTERDEILSDSKMIYQAPQDDKSAAFARWLVHCVGAYYGLRTWSVDREVDVHVDREGDANVDLAEMRVGLGAGTGDVTKKHTEIRREAYVGIDRRARGVMGRGWVGREVELPRPLWGMV